MGAHSKVRAPQDASRPGRGGEERQRVHTSRADKDASRRRETSLEEAAARGKAVQADQGRRGSAEATRGRQADRDWCG
ncbi:hypothetical protein BD626DRAFT_501816 [Schizophyllum amplum]|uniref:Uncharacterized protein n=1 Tax=Schizophyllum amplum TaxID=97359 RepID=A0A550C8W1_9AGAR|nr:hypothetical protein BD626DRAFT_501816 [Auriculariopsis ampla]